MGLDEFSRDLGSWEKWGLLVVKSITQLEAAITEVKGQVDKVLEQVSEGNREVNERIGKAEREIEVLKAQVKIYIAVAGFVSGAASAILTAIAVKTIGS